MKNAINTAGILLADGALLGAAIGEIVEHQLGFPSTGTLVGAAIGVVVGIVIGIVTKQKL